MGQGRHVSVQPFGHDVEDAPSTARCADGTRLTSVHGGCTQIRPTPGPGLQPFVPLGFCGRMELLSQAPLLQGAQPWAPGMRQ